MSNQIHEVFPYLRVRGAEAAIAFYKSVFGAEEVMRLAEPGGRIGHAQLKIGNTMIMLADEHPEFGTVGPETLGGTTFSLHLHVDNADELAARAVAAGATIIRELKDQFFGERTGAIRDPFGHEWLLGHTVEQVSPEEMQRRYTKLMS